MNPALPTPRRHSHAFTLLEIMVVVIILGVLAATIIPQFVGTTQEAKTGAAKAHIAELSSALERFYLHMDRYPSQDEGLAVLESAPANDGGKWRGPYIKKLRPDPWGNPYLYRRPGTHLPNSYDLWSKGADTAGSTEIGNW